MSSHSKLWDLLWIILPAPLDTEILGVLGIDAPGVEPIDVSSLSGFRKVLLVIFILMPYSLDREIFSLFGIDPFKTSETAALDDPAFDRTKSMGVTGGAKKRAQQHARRAKPNVSREGIGAKLVDAVVKLGKGLLKASPIIIIVALIGFLGYGFIGGSGYGALLGGELSTNLVSSGIDDPLAGVSTTVSQGFQTIQCFGNAACMRQWRFNNTERPGSEERGESYKLEIDGPNVNDGYALDINGRPKSYNIPVDFTAYNPRNGLKGITARNAEYKISIEGFDHQDEDSYCTTGWKPLTGAYAEQNAGDGTILPGGSAGSMEELEELGLTNCGLLQPGFGISRAVTLQIKYDYSSQSTLNFEAMSYKSAQSRNLLPPSTKQSKTADTPVKTYVNVDSPVLWFQNNENGGEVTSQDFTVRMGWETDESLKYRVDPEDTMLVDSDRTTHVEGKECRLQSDGDNKYTLSENETDYMEYQQKDRWWTQNSGPTPVSCTMRLQNPGTLSPSGETLRMRVDANYTVMLEQETSGFTVENSRCGEADRNCPLLVTQSVNEEEYDGKLLDTCDSRKHPDAANGCDVMESWNRRQIKLANDKNVDEDLENGEIAYEFSELSSKLLDYSEGEPVLPGSTESAVGISQEELKKFSDDTTGDSFVVREEDGVVDATYREVYQKACKPIPSIKEMKDIWMDEYAVDVEETLFFNPFLIECSEDNIDDVGEWYEGDKEKNAEQACRDSGGIPVLDSGTLQCWGVS